MIIGYVGLGLMGAPCVHNLLKAGYTVHVWARNPKATASLTDAGAIAAASLQELGAAVDVLFTNVSDTPDVEEVLLGPTGVVHCGKKGLVIVDMSTISAIATRDIHARLANAGMEFVDAPVSGGTTGAKQGTLTFMVGASQATFDRIQPILASMGKTITRIGDVGAGQVAKSCNQIIITGTIAAVAEAITFAQAANVDFTPVRQALMGGFASSRVLDLHGQAMINDSYAPGFKIALHNKDINIVTKLAAELGLSLPQTTLGSSLLGKAIEAGYGEEDSSALRKVIRDM